jgi:hypothetical protein
MGWGGRGRRNWFYATGLPGWMRYSQGYPAWGGMPYSSYAPPSPQMPQYSQEQEMEMLQQQAEYFGKSLEEIKKRIAELEAEKADKK